MSKRFQPDQRPLGDPGSSAFQLENYPFYQLNRTVSRYNMAIGSQLRPIGLDIPRWRVLMVLGENSPRSIGDIALACVINLSTMMRIVGRMADTGLVSLSPAAHDARITEVAITPNGEELLAEARKATAPIYRRAIKDFSPEAFADLLTSLQKMHRNLE